jgi:signal transduction histidine kinase
MSSPTTLPYRFKIAIAVALPTCALIFFGSAHIVIEGRERDSRRMVRASMEARVKEQAALTVMVYAEASMQLYALTLNPVFLEPYKEALARRQSLEHAWDQAAVRNTFATMERIEKYVDTRSPRQGDPRLTILLTDGRESLDNLRQETARFQRDRDLAVDNLDRQLFADRRVDRLLTFLTLPAALFAALFSAWLLKAWLLKTWLLKGWLLKAMRRAAAPLIDQNRQLARRNEGQAEALKSLREASAQKSRFLAHMSHELRTPLNSIIGFTEVICDKRAGPLTEIQEEFLGDSLRSARHLLALINDILDLEKIAAGHLVLNPEPLDLHLLIEETVHELSILAAVEKKVRLASELDEQVRHVVLDRQKTKQILINLITNAIKFTPDGGRITVRARTAGTGRCVLEIDDTGVGISEEGQTRLFREFEQLELAPSQRLQGTGLGLALTKKLVEAQGGTIAVSSQTGVGSTFCVMLPTTLELPAQEAMLAATPLSGAAPDNCAEPADSGFWFADNKGHVLIIDDDVNTHKLAKKALQDSGLEVTACFDGESGLAEIERVRPAVVIVDLLMPRLDGFNLIERLRQNPVLRTLPIVVWTNLDLTGPEFDNLARKVARIVNKRGLDISRLIAELRRESRQLEQVPQ